MNFLIHFEEKKNLLLASDLNICFLSQPSVSITIFGLWTGGLTERNWTQGKLYRHFSVISDILQSKQLNYPIMKIIITRSPTRCLHSLHSRSNDRNILCVCVCVINE